MIETTPGGTFYATLTEAPQGLDGTITLRVERLPAETVVLAASVADITEYPQTDGTSNYQAVRTMPTDAAPSGGGVEYRVVWDDGTVEVAESLLLITGRTTVGFPTAEDVAAALNLGRDLTDAEMVRVGHVLDGAIGAVAAAADKDDAWADTLDPVPRILRFVVTEAACRAYGNPQGVQSEQEQIGSYSHATRFGRAEVTLTEREEQMVRREVYGTSSGSSRPEGFVEELHDHFYGS